jgi:hypothetical protein
MLRYKTSLVLNYTPPEDAKALPKVVECVAGVANKIRYKIRMYVLRYSSLLLMIYE